MKNSNSTLTEDHLSKPTREFLESCVDSDLQKRIDKIQGEGWIGYETARFIIDRIEDLIGRPRVTRMHSLLVIGTTDNGKTTIRKRIEMKYRHFAKSDGKMEFPVVSIQMPPNPDEKTFYNALLKGAMHPPFIAGKVEHLRERVIDTLGDLNTKLLMIDEVQHIDRMPYRKQRSILDSIKYMSNELSLPMAAFGTEEAINVFASDPQLQNRFKKVFLPKWDIDEKLRRLLASFEKVLPLKEPSGLSDDDLALHIYAKTNGTLGELNNLIRCSAVHALKSGTERITRSIIDEVNFESSKSEAF